MEKRKPLYNLDAVKTQVLDRGTDVFTATALRGIDSMGLDEAEGWSVVLGLQPVMQFKSMTTHSDNKVWQDVYHAPVQTERMLISRSHCKLERL